MGISLKELEEISYYSMFSAEFNNTKIDTGMSVRAYEYFAEKSRRNFGLSKA